MTAIGEVLYLPIPSPVRSVYSAINLKRHYPREEQQPTQQRAHRIPKNDYPRYTYGANGYTVIERSVTGRVIDIYA